MVLVYNTIPDYDYSYYFISIITCNTYICSAYSFCHCEKPRKEKQFTFLYYIYYHNNYYQHHNV